MNMLISVRTAIREPLPPRAAVRPRQEREVELSPFDVGFGVAAAAQARRSASRPSTRSNAYGRSSPSGRSSACRRRCWPTAAAASTASRSRCRYRWRRGDADRGTRWDEAGRGAGRPAEDSPWDGIAEQWFDTADDYQAVYGRKDRPTRADTLAHTSRFQRMVVEDFEISL